MTTPERAPEDREAGSVWVASLVAVHDVLAKTRARHLVTVMQDPSMMATPPWIATDDHLRLASSDVDNDGRSCADPDADHVRSLIAFAERWARRGPLVIHCMAGISRSPAAAFVVLCALNPEVTEAEVARRLRHASPSALPNRRLVAHGDAALGRNGRMLAALATLGPCEASSASAHGFRLDSALS